jgi:hypothetical protein
MAKYTFKSDLSVKGIENLQKELLNYKNNILQRKVDLLVKTLADKGVAMAKANVKDFDAIFTADLYDSIHTEFESSGKGTAIFYIVADSEHAIYVELGTGQMGAENPYPGKLPVTYMQGKSIQQAKEDIYVRGDLYIQEGDYFWIYIGEDGKTHITKGMPSRPFMYETSLDLYRIVEKTAKEVFLGK